MRQFQSLNHPEPDELGVQRYSVHEVIIDSSELHGKRYVLVADDLDAQQVDDFVRENGELEL